MTGKSLKLRLLFTLVLTIFLAPHDELSAATGYDHDEPSIYECGNEELVADLEVLRGWAYRFVVSEDDGNSIYGRTAYTRVIRIYCKGHDIRYLVGGGQFFSVFSTAEVVPHIRPGQMLRQLRLQRTPYRNSGRGYHFSADFN